MPEIESSSEKELLGCVFFFFKKNLFFLHAQEISYSFIKSSIFISVNGNSCVILLQSCLRNCVSTKVRFVVFEKMSAIENVSVGKCQWDIKMVLVDRTRA